MDNVEEIIIQVENWIKVGYTLTDCAESLNIHRTTLWRWLKKNDLWKGVYTQFTVHEVCWLIRSTVSIEEHAIMWGIRFIHAHLRRLGYKISRNMIREALNILMPDLLQRRYQGCLVRRDYDVYLPMHVWHIDSHDKLARWGIRIHGAIDGATHYIVYMLVCLNKKAETIYNTYYAAVRKFGHPLLIRSDYATEHSLIERDINMARPNTHAFRKGPSVHNQRIEAFWRTLREKVTGYYQEALHILSFEEGILQIENPLHRASLVSVFLPVLKAAVENYIATWNAHKVRAVTERGRCRPAHIPELAFQAAERERGIVLPPSYEEHVMIPINEDDIDNREARSPSMELDQQQNEGIHLGSDEWNHSNDNGQFEARIQDIENEDLKSIRDLAFSLNHNRVRLITLKFKMHLYLTLECAECNANSMDLEDYVNLKLSQPNLPEDTFLTLKILRETLEFLRAQRNLP